MQGSHPKNVQTFFADTMTRYYKNEKPDNKMFQLRNYILIFYKEKKWGLEQIPVKKRV